MLANIDAESILSILQQHRPELERAGIRHLSLFGSIARGEAGPDSDVDLVAELDRDAHIGLFGLVSLEGRLGDLLGRKVDLIPEPVQKQRLQKNIDRDRRRAF